MNCRDCEPLLNPYLDGELPVTDVLAIERHLAECVACRSQYQGLDTLRAEIAAAHLDYVPPRRLAERIERSRPRAGKARRQWWWGLGAAAAAAAALLVVLVPPRLQTQPDAAGREALDAHLRSLMASNLVDVPSSDHHTVKPWFQGKLGFSPEVPDLSQQGYVLVGGRLDVIEQRRAAALVYRRRNHVINLLIVERGGTSPPDRSSEAEGYHLISWHDSRLAYWAVSDLNVRELEEFTQLIRGK